MFLDLNLGQMLKFRHFGGKKKLQPKTSLSIVLHQALQLNQYLLVLSCCEEFQDKQALVTCLNEESSEKPDKVIYANL